MQPVIDQYRFVIEDFDPDAEFIIPTVNERLSEEELLEWIGDIDGVICGDDAFTERVLKAAPKLKVISKWGTGIDSIDQQAAKKLGIAVCNTTDAFTHPVADSVLGYMLCFARGLVSMDRNMRSGQWEKTMGFALREATLGIIGAGNVGRAVAQRAVAFGMTVICNDVAEIPASVLSDLKMESLSKEDLLARSDFVSLNCDLNSSSHHLIGKPELAMMKPTAYLINTARGARVDEQALVWALQNGEIAGAGLDVFEVEPLPKESRLREFESCLLSPHNSNSSPEAYSRVHENTIRNLLNVLQASPTG